MTKEEIIEAVRDYYEADISDLTYDDGNSKEWDKHINDAFVLNGIAISTELRVLGFWGYKSSCDRDLEPEYYMHSEIMVVRVNASEGGREIFSSDTDIHLIYTY